MNSRSHEPATAGDPGARRRLILRGVGVLLVVVAGAAVLRWLQQSGLMTRALDWISGLGPWGPVAFVGIYTLAVVLLVPASVFTLGAAFLFGLAWGSFYVLLAANLASTISFLVSRHLAREAVARRLQRHAWFRAVDDATAREGWKVVALVRLAPVFPFSLTSYAFGLTRVPFRGYALANLAMIPGTFMYIYFGSVARDVAERPPAPLWLKWIVGAITVAVILYISRFAKRALARTLA